MGVGLAPADAGLEGFDVDAAAADLAAVEDDARKRMAADLMADPNVVAAPPGVLASVPVDAVSGGMVPQQGGTAPDGSHTPDLAGSTPASATAAPPGGPPPPASAPGGAAPTDANGFPVGPTLEPLGPPPPPPPITGDPAKDVQANLLWSRQLNDYSVKATAHQAALNKHTASVDAVKAGREARAAEEADKARVQERVRYLEEQQKIATDIADATKARADAYGEVENAKFSGKYTGQEIAALIISGIGAAFQNMAAAQVGGVGNAKNEAMLGIERRMAKEYETKKAKLAAAGDALLAAKYGQKTSAENHRAALNDLDGDQAAKFKLIAKQAEQAIRARGGTDADVKQNEIVLKANQEAAKSEGNIQSREEGHKNQKEASAATLALARANLGERRREFDEGRINREADRKDKADEKRAEKDQSLEVRDRDGNVRGYANTSRVVKPAQDRMIQYEDAAESLRGLLKRIEDHPITGRLPVGDEYDRAVLAVAATTTANASDATTAHEAATLKNFGLASPDAVRRTLEHVERRQEAFLKQLRPLDGEKRESTPRPPEESPRSTPSTPLPRAAPSRAPKQEKPKGEGFTASGGVKYEMGADGNYHKVK